MKELLTFACILLVACDPIPPPANPPPPTGTCQVEGQIYGACAPDTYDGTCAEGLSCLSVPEGWICLPAQNPPSTEVKDCAASIGTLVCVPEFGNACFITCESGLDTECGGGTVCDDQYHLCVWPGGDLPWPSTSTSEPLTTDTTGTSTE